MTTALYLMNVLWGGQVSLLFVANFLLLLFLLETESKIILIVQINRLCQKPGTYFLLGQKSTQPVNCLVRGQRHSKFKPSWQLQAYDISLASSSPV